MDNIKKQAKNDIFNEIYPIINFYIKKGATPDGLKKFYKKVKNVNGLIEDIKSKGSNLIEDDKEYIKLVRDVLSEILQDVIARKKDEKSKLKHIKEFNSFN
jgi:hypothetical protein